MNTVSGFPTDDLDEIAKNGSIIPMKISQTGQQNEPLIEVLICTSIEGRHESGLPRKITLTLVKHGGETESRVYILE